MHEGRSPTTTRNSFASRELVQVQCLLPLDLLIGQMFINFVGEIVFVRQIFLRRRPQRQAITATAATAAAAAAMGVVH